MILQKGKMSIKFRDIARNNNGFMLGVKATRDKIIQDCALRVNLNVNPALDVYKNNVHPELPTKQRKIVQFQKNSEIIEANSKAPRVVKIHTTRFHHVL